MKCVVCGNRALVEGYAVDETSTAGFQFQPADTPWLRRTFGIGARPVRSYGCIRCGHLEFIVEFSQEDRARYEQFEGQQPSVLERLNPDSDEPEQS